MVKMWNGVKKRINGRVFVSSNDYIILLFLLMSKEKHYILEILAVARPVPKPLTVGAIWTE